MEEQVGPNPPAQVVLDAVLSAVEAGQETRLRISGASMAPVLLPGDWAVVRAIHGNLAEGQIVVVRRAGDLVTHRLVAQTPGGWVTKGDALSSPDPPVGSDAILGVVTSRERMGKWISLQTAAWERRGRRLARLGRWEAALLGALQVGQLAGWHGKPWAARLAWLWRIPFRLGVILLSKW